MKIIRNNRRGVLVALMACLLASNSAFGQTAKQVLEKTATVVSAASGVQAQFSIKGTAINASGSISVKGNKFCATTPEAAIWFDGKTQWTYLRKNDEVNVSSPTEAQLTAINPYNFIYLYKKGYTYTMEKKATTYIVHLTATDKKKPIQEMYITIAQKSHTPSQIRMKQTKGWTTIDISHFKTAHLADANFRFNSKDFPTAEVIDLR